ncbi:hypothetical protein SCB49_14625 [unidentified eubacterium SCB49]|nr:hypothetical protein SCB49_14625 [unidentified eubacterium SCB49]
MTKKQKKLFYKIIFFVGLGAMIWEIRIYRQTIIDINILLGIIFTIGILTMFFTLNDFQKLFKYNRKSSLYFWTFIQSTVSWGFLACSIFMFTNYYMASEKSYKQSFEIVERSSMTGRKYHRDERKPTFKIMYNGKLKELVFTHKYYDKMESYQNIEFIVKKGFLGYDLLVEQKLK